eukprot:scaffold10020_cov161-Skeletonema_marinoi.AAC.14
MDGCVEVGAWSGVWYGCSCLACMHAVACSCSDSDYFLYCAWVKLKQRLGSNTIKYLRIADVVDIRCNEKVSDQTLLISKVRFGLTFSSMFGFAQQVPVLTQTPHKAAMYAIVCYGVILRLSIIAFDELAASSYD